MLEKSFAKINLGLSILHERDDLFHDIDTIFIELAFHDTIDFVASDNFVLTTQKANIPIQSNLVSKVYKFYKNNFDNIDDDFHITISKNIPIGGGLGGGSSNAACALKSLNKLWNLNLSEDELELIALNFGADVPFFIRGGAQRGTGIGERLERVDIKFLKDKGVTLLMPNVQISTKWAYSKLKKTLQVSNKDNKLRAPQNIEGLKLFENDFENVVLSAYPEIGRAKDSLLNSGATYASLSGSGSTVYGIYDDVVAFNSFHSNFSIYPSVQSFLRV